MNRPAFPSATGGASAARPGAVRRAAPLPDEGALAPPRSPGLYIALGCAAWVAAAASFPAAVGPLARGEPLDDTAALAGHLVGLGALPLLVLGCAWALLPGLAGVRFRERMLGLALPLVAGGFLLAPGIAFTVPALVAPGSALLAVGFVVAARELLRAARALRSAGRGYAATALRLAILQIVIALVAGPVVFARGDEPILGIPHERLVLLLPALASLAWLPLSLLALAPALAPRRLRRGSLAAYGIVLAAWALVGGVAAGSLPAAASGAGALVLLLAALGLGAARSSPAAVGSPEAGFALAAALALVQALALGGLAFAGAVDPGRGAGAYTILLLAGWAVAACVALERSLRAHAGWASLALASAHLAGVELAAFGVLAGAERLALAGGALVLVPAVVLLVGALAGRRPGRGRAVDAR